MLALILFLTIWALVFTIVIGFQVYKIIRFQIDFMAKEQKIHDLTIRQMETKLAALKVMRKQHKTIKQLAKTDTANKKEI